MTHRIQKLLSGLAVTAAAAGLLLLLPAPASAASMHFAVDRFDDAVSPVADGICAAPGGGCTLREAIMEANANPGHDTIHLAPGTYTLSLTGTESATGINVAIKDLDITDGVTITGTGGNRDGNPDTTFIEAGPTFGSGIDRVFHIRIDPTLPGVSGDVTFEALTVRHGNAGASGHGGGIYGAAVTGPSTVHIYNSIILHNTAGRSGGGLGLANSQVHAGLLAIVEQSAVVENEAGSASPGTASPAGGLGGGISVSDGFALQVRGSTILGNVARQGGINTGDGGGIYWWDDGGVPANPSYVSDTVIAGNQALDQTGIAARGGGMYVGRPLRVTNTSVFGNHAAYDGGGLYHSAVSGDSHTLEGVTISANTAGSAGSSDLMLTPSGTGAMTLTNLTINGNVHINGDGPVRLYNSIHVGALTGSALHPESAFNLTGLTAEQAGLGPLEDNGPALPAHLGAHLTHGLRFGSPALDAGSNALTTASTDGRGHPRLLDAADADLEDRVDIGAVEMHPTMGPVAGVTGMQDASAPITTTFTVGDGDLPMTGAVTLASESMPGLFTGGTVTFAGSTGTAAVTTGPGTYGTATLRVSVGPLQYDDFVLTVLPRPDLTVTKSHVGDFVQGGAAEYTISVQNLGPVSTLLPGAPLLPDTTYITVTDTLPTGLTPVNWNGPGWTCAVSGQTYTCEYGLILSAGSSAPPLTLLAQVEAGAPAEVVNTATVSGGGDNSPANNTTSDLATVQQNADLAIAKSQAGDFHQGQTGAVYTLTVTNVGQGTFTGPVTVTDLLPAGLTATAMEGDGWTCELGALTCTRFDQLAAGSEYPPITLTVDVAVDAPTLVVNTATVAGDFDPTNNTATVETLVRQLSGLALEPAAGQYSDMVTLVATVTPAIPGTVTFTAGSATLGTAPVDQGTATLGWAISLPAGTYDLKALFAPADPQYLPSEAAVSLTVTRENATVTAASSNPVQVQVGSPGGTAGSVTLSAAISEPADGSPGDIALAVPVTFTLNPVGPGTPMVCTSTSNTCTFSNVPVNVYDVSILVGGDYYTGQGSSVLTVFDPSLGVVTGGGHLLLNGQKATFGFSAKYQKDGTTQGQFLLTLHLPEGDVRAKSTAIQSLAITQNTAIILGQATYDSQPGYSFRVVVTDNGEPGTQDLLGLRLLDFTGAVVLDLTFDPLPLTGGNIQVPQPKN